MDPAVSLTGQMRQGHCFKSVLKPKRKRSEPERRDAGPGRCLRGLYESHSEPVSFSAPHSSSRCNREKPNTHKKTQDDKIERGRAGTLAQYRERS